MTPEKLVAAPEPGPGSGARSRCAPHDLSDQRGDHDEKLQVLFHFGLLAPCGRRSGRRPFLFAEFYRNGQHGNDLFEKSCRIVRFKNRGSRKIRDQQRVFHL